MLNKLEKYHLDSLLLYLYIGLNLLFPFNIISFSYKKIMT